MKKQKGFSLIELLIVVAIILIIAAIAIPNLLRARIAANESAVVANMRTINTAEITYLSSYNTFAPTLISLDNGGTCPATPTAANACLIDNTLAAATTAATGKSGYFFTYVSVAPNSNFTLNSTPVSASTGVKHFFTDETGVVRVGATAPATVASPAI